MHVCMYVRFTSSFRVTLQRGIVGGDRPELSVDSDSPARQPTGGLFLVR